MTARFLDDTAALTGRTLRHVTRSVDTIITTTVTPIALMLLFVYVFGSAIRTGDGSGDYIDYLLPGILLITIASGVTYTALRLFTDLKDGVFARFQSMPIARSGVLWAHVLASLIAVAASLLLVLVVALVIGFRSSAGVAAWLGVAAILLLFSLGLTWLAVIPGLSAKTAEGAAVFAYPLIFLPFVSSAFVPTEGMPGPVRWFAEHQPVTPIIETVRALFAGQPVEGDLWVALVWCTALLVVAWAAAMAVYRRKIG